MPKTPKAQPMNIEELRGFVLLKEQNFRARERELLDLIRVMVNDRDLEPGMYRVEIVREGDKLAAESSKFEVLALRD